MSPEKGKMRIYGAGGCGINIAHALASTVTEKYLAELKISYIDTSRSNMLPDMDDKNVFVLDADGSGKIRSENYGQISDNVKRILSTHNPADFNVVVFSASGGSGSVIGPMIMKELAQRMAPVIAVVVGSDESLRSAENTLNTLKSLEGISKILKRPIVMHYLHNTRGKARTEIDERAQRIISLLAILASREIQEIDTMDITNWIYYDRVTGVAPRLASMDIFLDDDLQIEDFNPHSIISIFESPDKAHRQIYPEYSCDGYAAVPFVQNSNIHYMIDVESVNAYHAEISKTVTQMTEKRDSRPKANDVLTDQDAIDDNGMIL